MSNCASQAAAPATNTLSWIIRACQEYEQRSREWLDYSEKLKWENEQSSAAVYELEAEAGHMKELKSTQQQMISAQLDLIGALKDDIASKADPVLPSGMSETQQFPSARSPSETYSAALLLAMADAADTDE
jgi:hypothetical protein